MKKLIAIASLSLSFGFALALANTEDPAMNRDSETSSVTTETRQEAGTAGVASDTNPQNPGTNMPGDTSRSVSESPESTVSKNTKMSESRMPKSCTDEKGVMYREGQKGYKECMEGEKNKHPEQMGGTSEGESDMLQKTKELYKNMPSPKSTGK